MLIDNEYLHNVERSIFDKVVYYIKHQKEFTVPPCIYVNTRSGRVVMGERPDWKCCGWHLASVLCTTYDGHRVVDTKYIGKWAKKELFKNATIW